eukprot:723088-Prorocentrum_minimum.AAC.1
MGAEKYALNRLTACTETATKGRNCFAPLGPQTNASLAECCFTQRRALLPVVAWSGVPGWSGELLNARRGIIWAASTGDETAFATEAETKAEDTGTGP